MFVTNKFAPLLRHLNAICRTLNCQPGDLLEGIPDGEPAQEPAALNKK
jgi:DNA-binding Xre family transcriptional regulator